MIRFRYKKSIPLDYDQQGYVYFVSRRYRFLPQDMKRSIRELCREAGGEHRQALFSFVTTDAGATEVCAKHYLSPSTLERLVVKYYTAFAESI